MDLSFCISMPIGAWHPFLPAALESLLSQKAAVNIAFLDASGDPRVKALADTHAQRLAFRRHGPDKGQSAAIIEGWANAPGAILGWLNADDILMPGALEKARDAFLADAALDMVYGHSVILDEEARMVGYHWAVERPGPRIFEGGVISQPSCFFKRQAYERAGGLDESLHYTMDWDLWIRLYKSGANVGFVDAALSQVLWGDETKTASFNARRRSELQRIIQEYAPPEKRAKIFRAFALHNLMNRIRPLALKTLVTRALHRGRAEIYGLRADGFIASRAVLALAHYDPAAHDGVELLFDKAPEGLDVRAGVAIASVSLSGALAVVTFATPVEQGETVSLEVSAPKGAWFRHCEWA